jgi:Flp pilus assembly protein TadD/fido (protein-threonine AMPylation protein)
MDKNANQALCSSRPTRFESCCNRSSARPKSWSKLGRQEVWRGLEPDAVVFLLWYDVINDWTSTATAEVVGEMPASSIRAEFESAVEHHRLGRHQLAAAGYRRILSRTPKHVPSLENLGVLLHQQGKNAEAVLLFERALAANPESEKGWQNLSYALIALGRWEESQRACRRAITLRPDLPELWNNLGIALMGLHQWGEAEDACRKAAALRPDFPEAWNNLGCSLISRARWREAEDVCQRAVRLRSDYWEAWNNLGIALIGMHRWREAEDACRKALSLKPDFPRAWNNLGNAQIGLRQWAEAENACRKALSLQPNYLAAWQTLSRALSGQNRLDEAAEASRHVAALQPLPDSSLRELEGANAGRLQEIVDRIVLQTTADGLPFVLTEDIIRHLHRMAMDGLLENPGEYRTRPVWMTNEEHVPPAWDEVPTLMNDLCHYVNDNWTDRDMFHLCAFALWRLNWIHPFIEGNGRIARAVSQTVFCIKHGGVLPVIARIVRNRNLYYTNLHYAHQMFLSTQSVELAVQPMEQWLRQLLKGP